MRDCLGRPDRCSAGGARIRPRRPLGSVVFGLAMKGPCGSVAQTIDAFRAEAVNFIRPKEGEIEPAFSGT